MCCMAILTKQFELQAHAHLHSTGGLHACSVARISCLTLCSSCSTPCTPCSREASRSLTTRCCTPSQTRVFIRSAQKRMNNTGLTAPVLVHAKGELEKAGDQLLVPAVNLIRSSGSACITNKGVLKHAPALQRF